MAAALVAVAVTFAAPASAETGMSDNETYSVSLTSTIEM